MSDVAKARELEDLQYTKLIESLNEEEQEHVAQINAKFAAHGTYQSGGRLNAIVKLRVNKLKRLIDGRADIRRRMATEFPELGSENAIDDLLARLDTMFAHGFAAFREPANASI